MLEKLNNSFWFWSTLAFVNILTLFLVIEIDDKFTCTLSSCMLFFSFAKALKIASNSEENER